MWNWNWSSLWTHNSQCSITKSLVCYIIIQASQPSRVCCCYYNHDTEFKVTTEFNWIEPNWRNKYIRIHGEGIHSEKSIPSWECQMWNVLRIAIPNFNLPIFHRKAKQCFMHWHNSMKRVNWVKDFRVHLDFESKLNLDVMCYAMPCHAMSCHAMMSMWHL